MEELGIYNGCCKIRIKLDRNQEEIYLMFVQNTDFFVRNFACSKFVAINEKGKFKVQGRCALTLAIAPPSGTLLGNPHPYVH